MKVLACKKCNICNEVVAVKYGFFYRTQRYYITLRSDAISIYDGHTEKDHVHICSDCWMHLKYYVHSKVEQKNANQ